jgi:AAA+ superfamily predicted ATPase
MNNESLLKLNSLIGMSKVKSSLSNILHPIEADKIRKEKLGTTGSEACINLNFVFRGNPGTGKTIVARLTGEILCEYGLLDSSEIVECTRNDIIGPYVGHTVNNLRALFESAVGKTLFFKEVFSPVLDKQDSFGKEVVNTIIGLMTDPLFNGKMAVIISGYPHTIDDFLVQNPEISRLFNHIIDFDDYSNEELGQIYRQMIEKSGFKLDDGCEAKAVEWFEKQTRGKNFANARLASCLVDLTKTNLDTRIVDADEEILSHEFLVTIIEQDFSEIVEDK